MIRFDFFLNGSSSSESSLILDAFSTEISSSSQKSLNLILLAFILDAFSNVFSRYAVALALFVICLRFLDNELVYEDAVAISALVTVSITSSDALMHLSIDLM